MDECLVRNMKIFSRNEYSELKTVIVGSCKNHSWPKNDVDFDRMIKSSTYQPIPTMSSLPTHILEEAEEDLEGLVEIFNKNNVQTIRPSTDSEHWAYSARDILLCAGAHIIECPTQFKSRKAEADLYLDLKVSAKNNAVKWTESLSPEYKDDPCFDAANICKFDNHLLYLVSSTGNKEGAEWLQQQVGTDFEVVVWENIYAHAHIDSTIVSLNSSTVLFNADRVKEESIPNFLRSHTHIWIDDVMPRSFYKFPFASKWIGLNLLSINPETVVVDPIQVALIEKLEYNNFNVIEHSLRHSRTLGGGHHCVTLDILRN